MSPTATLGAIRNALDLLHEPGEVVELRIPRVLKNRYTVAGYFDDFDKLARAAAGTRRYLRRMRLARAIEQVLRHGIHGQRHAVN